MDRNVLAQALLAELEKQEVEAGVYVATDGDLGSVRIDGLVDLLALADAALEAVRKEGSDGA